MTLRRIAFAFLIVATVGVSFAGSLFMLDYRDQRQVWPTQVTATRVDPRAAADAALDVTVLGEAQYWSMALLEPARVAFSALPVGLTVRHRATSATPPTVVSSSTTGAWLLPSGQYLLELPTKTRAAAPLALKVSPWTPRVAAPVALDAGTLEGFDLVEVIVRNLDAQTERLRGVARQKPELVAVGKILTQPLTDAGALHPDLARATREVGGPRPGFGAFTASDTSSIWLQATGLAPLACQFYIWRARSTTRPKALDYVYVNSHDSTRNILPLKEEDVDPTRLCNEPLNKVTAGVKWL